MSFAAIQPAGPSERPAKLESLPLILPSPNHGLRDLLEAAFARIRVTPNVVTEIDGLSLLVNAVRAGHGATIQPGAAMVRLGLGDCVSVPLKDGTAIRRNLHAIRAQFPDRMKAEPSHLREASTQASEYDCIAAYSDTANQPSLKVHSKTCRNRYKNF